MLHPISKGFSLVGMTLLALLTASALALGLTSVSTVYADSIITVNTFTDAIDTSGDCSLREAIIAADSDSAVDGCPAGSGNDVIVLAAGIYTLAIAGESEHASLTGDLDVTMPQGLLIQGAGVLTTTIDGGALDRIFEIRNVDSHVTIADLTLQNGRVITGEGSGAIKNLGYLTLTQTSIQNNVVLGQTSGDIGGAICNGCGAGTGNLVIISSTVRANSADRGGGIFSNAQMTITNSSIISNSARAGGGVINYASSGGGILMVNSTVSGNFAEGNSGGILQNAGTFTLINSTIAHNRASDGGGIGYSEGTISLLNTLVAHNEGGNCYGIGTLTSNGYNLSSDDTCPFTTTGDIVETDPLLLPLALNEIMPTYRLSFRSPAIDAATNRDCPTFDQVGTPRPQTSICDIGAIEYTGTLFPLYTPLIKK